MYMINSSIVSAQNRVRMYITDFEFDIPEDKIFTKTEVKRFDWARQIEKDYRFL